MHVYYVYLPTILYTYSSYLLSLSYGIKINRINNMLPIFADKSCNNIEGIPKYDDVLKKIFVCTYLPNTMKIQEILSGKNARV